MKKIFYLTILLSGSINLNLISAGTYMDVDSGAPPAPAKIGVVIDLEAQKRKLFKNIEKGRTKEVISQLESGDFTGDELSPDGVSMLAVALLNKNKDIVKYLLGKEKKLTAKDQEFFKITDATAKEFAEEEEMKEA